MVTNREKGKRYDPALIERARALGEEIGIVRAARLLGVSRDAVQSWVRRKRQGMHSSSANTPEKKELVETKRELQKLKRENEELKKANIVLKELASVFSKDHPSSDLEWSLKSGKNGKKN
jgi:transposase